MDCEREPHHKLVKKKSGKKHKTSKRKKKNDSSGDEAVDLSEKIHPIVYYISDREEMIKQVFSVMEKEKLNCMLPPMLKGMTISALKESCLKELRNMSDDVVRKVLCGECVESYDMEVTAPSKIDSDSCVSVSSGEEYHNVGEEKRTLLDILEQEMQEIAYNTVLKRDEKSLSELEADDEMQDVVAITPTNSPPRVTNNVPLICIDSDDEEIASSGTSVLLSALSVSDKFITTNDNDIIIDGDKTAVSPAVTKHKNIDKTNLTTVPDASNDESAGSRSQYNYKLSNAPLSETCTKPKENFVIQVFSSKTSVAERVVKKVCELVTSGKDSHEDSSVNIKEPSAYEGSEGSASILVNEGNKQETEVAATEESEEVICLDENPTDLNDSSRKHLDPISDPTSLIRLVDTCVGLNDLNESAHCNTDENVAGSPKAGEKEEGEITEEESEESVVVVQPLQDRHQTPTIYLSSDGIKSDVESPESRGKARKHHHRHRRSKRSTESPERSRRRLDKRGNRSYRRKTSTPKENKNISITEKGEERAEKNHTTSETTLSREENNTPLTYVPTETSATGQGDVESLEQVTEEKMNTENFETASSPNTLEIHISDTKLDSSEETEASGVGQPESTKTSWADRWAEKKDLKKVVITSKICQNVRKRILSARRKQSKQEPDSIQTPALTPVPPVVQHVEGSVQEYQRLQLLVSDICEEDHPKCDSNRGDIGTEITSPVLKTITYIDEPHVDNAFKTSDLVPELPKSDIEEHGTTNKMECTEM